MQNKLSLLLLVSTSLGASAPGGSKYTAEQLKQLKPPLAAQQFTLKPKACWPPTSMPPLDLNHALTAIPEVQSPTPSRRKLKKLYKAPKNSVDLSASAKKFIIPFPEVIITFEAVK